MSLGTVVMLVGSLRPTALSSSLGLHALELPVAVDMSLLDAWLGVLRECGLDEIRIVVNTTDDATRVDCLMDSGAAHGIRVMSEPASCRGSAGLVRDVTEDLGPTDLVTVIEGAALPPVTLEPLVDAMTSLTTAVIGATDRHEPAGAYMFRRGVFESIPRVGYHDMKEQLLPTINAQRRVAKLALLGREFCRIRDRRSYLHAVRCYAEREFLVPDIDRRSANARVLGSCIVPPGVAIGARALVQDSVLFPGSVIGNGAVICRSVIGPGAHVTPDSRIVDAIVSERPIESGRSRLPISRLVARN